MEDDAVLGSSSPLFDPNDELLQVAFPALTDDQGQAKTISKKSNQSRPPKPPTSDRTVKTHRDVEKQRRNEMASLHVSLRNLLPLSYLKGKRSMSDHLNEAIKYIKHLQETNKQLANNKDALLLKPPKNYSTKHVIMDIKPWESGGVQIIVSSEEGGEEEEAAAEPPPLLKLVHGLTQEGLDVVSCISTKVNNQLVHCIQAQAVDGSGIDVHNLQESLSNNISYY